MKNQDIRQSLITLITEQKENYYRLAYSYVKNEQDALDIIQDSIHKALRSVEKVHDSATLTSWFYKIVVRTSLDLLRKQKKLIPIEDSQFESNKHGQTDHYNDYDLRQAIDELPSKYKTIIILRYFEDVKIDEIADILDEKVGTIKTRLYKAHKILRLKIDEDENRR